GLYLVARQRAERDLPAIAARKPEAAPAVNELLAALGKAYPGAKRPAQPAVKAEDLLLALSRAELALSGL
ncbi:MAG TPA: hypothetical protein VIL72_06095, partial [Beijerinckiaceae bacterium]